MTQQKCAWCLGDPDYEAYHDREWGVPVYDDAVFFEFLLLETFQAGLSWITILKKRENFKAAFSNFNYQDIAQYQQTKIDSLLQNSGIVRNKLKIKAAITNAKLFMNVQAEFGSFSNYIWNFVDGKPLVTSIKSYKDAPSTSDLSDAVSKDLKKRGFKFVGSTVIYAFLQATGLINDHEISCFRYTDLS
ncbi:DNA-3-methyladenine glycosylase I [Bizionia sediminis]|uniref:DNA-3-methyladenine glycosylase I n=1 Tax=Bizionia sediminis TaxID=1737064 RepID=A0ABW5KQ99_9FLAO